MNVSISICPTDMEFPNGDRYDEDALLAAIREFIESRLGAAATISCLQVGHRQGDAWAKIDGDEEAGADLLQQFFHVHGADEDLFVAEPPPVMVEVASCDETIRICGGLDEFAGLEHTAIKEACEAYHRAATDSIMRSGGRLNWCVPSGKRVLHSQWMGAKWEWSRGAIGTMAAGLTSEECDAIDAAHDAGLEAARKVIAEADAAEAAARS